MPIYEYACLDCRQTFEVLTGYAEREAARICPACAGASVKPLFSRVSVLSGGQGTESASGGCGCGGNCACGAN
jgi:putative FmdB family regulatory protein